MTYCCPETCLLEHCSATQFHEYLEVRLAGDARQQCNREVQYLSAALPIVVIHSDSSAVLLLSKSGLDVSELMTLNSDRTVAEIADGLYRALIRVA